MRADHDIAPTPAPSPDEVQVFVVTLDLPESALAASRRLLSPEEIRRADAFLRPRDCGHFIAARAWLRRMLGARLGRAPDALVFAYGLNGKPSLQAASGRFDFNLSHSDGHALLALSPGFALGADIEAVRPVEEKLAERFFSAAEVQALAAMPPTHRTDAFFRGWTRKEAYLKALGSGLATPLDAFTVSLDPQVARLIDVAGEPGEADAWQIAHLDAGPGLMGTVAARRRGWRLSWPR